MVTIMSFPNQSTICEVTLREVFLGGAAKIFKTVITAIRYHPMIRIYFLSLAAKSSASHDEIWQDEKKVLVA